MPALIVLEPLRLSFSQPQADLLPCCPPLSECEDDACLEQVLGRMPVALGVKGASSRLRAADRRHLHSLQAEMFGWLGLVCQK